MSVSLDTNALAQQIKDVTLDAVNSVKEAVVGPSTDGAEKHRVFVGNLSPDVSEDELRDLFSKIGEIVSVTIPVKRSNRAKTGAPNSIAFVEFTGAAEAQKAVETVNGQSLGERELTVAIARPLRESKPRSKSPKTATKDEGKDAAAAATGESTSNGEKKKPRRKSKSKKTITDPVAATSGESISEEGPANTTSKSTESPTKPRSPRAPREKGPPSDGVPSSTTLFVAGLDHKTTDAELKEIFSTYNPTTAHVALRQIPRFMVKKLAEKGEQRLGRGFGFVTFTDQTAQQEALKAMDGHKVGERELAVKVAVDSSEKSAPTSNGQSSASSTAVAA